MTDLEPGLYDQLIDELPRQRLDSLATERLTADLQSVDPAELPDRVGEVLGHWVSDTLASVGAEDRPDAALHLSQAVLSAINEFQPDALQAERMIADRSSGWQRLNDSLQPTSRCTSAGP